MTLDIKRLLVEKTHQKKQVEVTAFIDYDMIDCNSL